MEELTTSFAEQKKLIQLAIKQADELNITLNRLKNFPMLLHSNNGEISIRFEQDNF